MAVPISIVGVGIVGVVGVVGIVAHDNHSRYSAYSDAAEKKAEVERKARLDKAYADLKNAENQKDAAVRSAIAEVEREFREENMPFPHHIRNMLKSRPERQASAHFASQEETILDEAKERIGQHLKREIDEKRRELENVNALLERINTVQLMGNKNG